MADQRFGESVSQFEQVKNRDETASTTKNRNAVTVKAHKSKSGQLERIDESIARHFEEYVRHFAEISISTRVLPQLEMEKAFIR
jgi:hypothetical protein